MKPKLEIDNYGTKRWKLPNGDLHREDGSAVEWDSGRKEWFLNGIRHRENGPAIEAMHYESWWLNGKLHRENGPALKTNTGGKEWYLNGIKYSEEEYKKELRFYKLKHILD